MANGISFAPIAFSRIHLLYIYIWDIYEEAFWYVFFIAGQGNKLSMSLLARTWSKYTVWYSAYSRYARSCQSNAEHILYVKSKIDIFYH